MRRVLPFALLLAAFPLAAAQPARPLPDPDAFVREVRKHLETDSDRVRDFAYTETRREAHLDGDGRTTDQSVKVIESYPGFPGQRRWERLISEDGKSVPAADLAKQDRKRQDDAEEYQRRAANQTPADRERRARARAERRREAQETLDDAFRVYQFKMIGREAIEGHDTIAFAMSPRPNATARTRIVGMLRQFQGRVWISEADYELVKIDVEAMDDMSLGMGLIARLHKGSRMMFQRRQVDGTWLPAHSSYTASARVLLLRRMRVSATSDFSNYRRFSVGTSTTYDLPNLD